MTSYAGVQLISTLLLGAIGLYFCIAAQCARARERAAIRRELAAFEALTKNCNERLRVEREHTTELVVWFLRNLAGAPRSSGHAIAYNALLDAAARLRKGEHWV
jgi:hypothetical protein